MPSSKLYGIRIGSGTFKIERAKSTVSIKKSTKIDSDENVKLKNWARKNVPEEGWKLTNNLKREIQLRIEYLKEKPEISWIEYLQSKGMKIIREVIKSDRKSQAKDYSKLLETRQKEIKELEQFIPKDTVSNFNSLLLSAEILRKSDTTELKGAEIGKHAINLKSFFEDAKFLLKNLEINDSMIKYLENIAGFMDVFKDIDDIKKMPSDVMNKIKTVVNQIYKETEKIKG